MSRAAVRGGLAVVAVAALTLGTALGTARRLSYHEAIWAQSGRELLAEGGLLVPTLDGRPWLEKPPLGTWLIAASGVLTGGVDEASARAPSALAAAILALIVARLAARRFGPGVGVLAGLVQATTAWLVVRGRLAEVDVPLAALVAGAMLALDRLRDGDRRARPWFFALLGLTGLAKGVGFGAALVLAAVGACLLWDRDRATVRLLAWPVGWALAALVALAWPALVVARHPEALGLWTLHVADRLAARPSHFAGEPFWSFALSPLAQALPWTPLALAGVWRSWRRARREPNGPDRLLWAWAVVPSALLATASVRNDHYLIHALPPWSVWAALALARLGERLRGRGWSPARLRRSAAALFAGVGMAYAAGFSLLGPRLDERGPEWAFYERVGRSLPGDEPLVFIYDDWDKQPYHTPFGPVPADLAARLFYLRRPATWMSADALADRPPAPPFAVIGRDRDLPALRRLGRVEPLARGPDRRWDRSYTLFRVTAGIAREDGPARRR